MSRRSLTLLAAALALTAASATACDNNNGTNGKDYIGGDGRVIQFDASKRGDPVELSGETVKGEQLDLADLRGTVVVVNVWGSWCPECRTEQPLLVDAVDELPAGASVVGIDIRDPSKDNALAFQRKYDVPYDSLYDPGSQTLLKFPTPFNPRVTPSTVVLDKEGRVAALILGVLPSKLTLLDVVQEVANEDG